MKAIISIFLTCLPCMVFCQQNPLDTLTFDSLVIYEMNWWTIEDGKKRRIQSIIEDNELAPSVENSARLSGKDAEEFSNNLKLKSSFGLRTAACFDPLFGAVYYESGKPKQFITICLACNNFRATFDIPASKQGKEEFEGQIYYTRYGFSMDYRNYLNDLNKKYGFQYLQSVEDPLFTDD